MLKLTPVILLTIFGCKPSADPGLKFHDPKFEKAVLSIHPEVDANKDGRIDKAEAESVRQLHLLGQGLTTATDIRHFPNLETLAFSINEIREFKISGFKHLKGLYGARNQLATVEITDMPVLNDIAFGLNQLKGITINNCPDLESLNLMDNQIMELDLKSFPKLEVLTVDNNKLTAIDVSQNPELVQIVINGNNIAEVDVRNNPKLKMNILYKDEATKIIGTPEQMKTYSRAPVVIAQ